MFVAPREDNRYPPLLTPLAGFVPMIDPELLKILACPDTRQPLSMADDALVTSLNGAIEKGGRAPGGRRTDCLRYYYGFRPL